MSDNIKTYSSFHLNESDVIDFTIRNNISETIVDVVLPFRKDDFKIELNGIEIKSINPSTEKIIFGNVNNRKLRLRR